MIACKKPTLALLALIILFPGRPITCYGEGFIKAGFIFSPADDELADRWLLSGGGDFSPASSLYLGFELAGGFYTDRISATADLGYPAAQEKVVQLSKLSLSEADWAAYLAERNSRKKTSIPIPAAIQVTGVNHDAQKAIEQQFANFISQPLNEAKLQEGLTKLVGEGRYQTLIIDLPLTDPPEIFCNSPSQKKHMRPPL